MDIKYPVAMRVAKIYEDKIKSKHEGLGFISVVAKATELYNKDSDANKKTHLRTAEAMIAEAKGKPRKPRKSKKKA
jgi:hypothetical protein